MRGSLPALAVAAGLTLFGKPLTARGQTPPRIGVLSGNCPDNVNLKTARALGLTLPPGILARADGVIE